MSYSRRLMIWIWRAWPVICAVGIISAHLLVLRLAPFPAANLNKIAGTVLQVLGGLIVLHSIDGNLGLFKQHGLLSSINRWLEDFPRRQTVIAAAVGTAHATGQSATLNGSAYVAGKTVEERLKLLERRLDEADRKLAQQRLELLERLDAATADLSKSISATRTELHDLSSKVLESTVGGVKQQLFGVLLAIYGAVVSAFA